MEKTEFPTLEEYEQQLRHHDWLYEYSDDDSVYRKGLDNSQRLSRIAADGAQSYKDLYLKIQREKAE